MQLHVILNIQVCAAAGQDVGENPQLDSPGCAVSVLVFVLGVVGGGNAEDGHQDAQHSNVDEVAHTLEQVRYTLLS